MVVQHGGRHHGSAAGALLEGRAAAALRSGARLCLVEGEEVDMLDFDAVDSSAHSSVANPAVRIGQLVDRLGLPASQVCSCTLCSCCRLSVAFLTNSTNILCSCWVCFSICSLFVEWSHSC